MGKRQYKSNWVLAYAHSLICTTYFKLDALPLFAAVFRLALSLTRSLAHGNLEVGVNENEDFV